MINLVTGGAGLIGSHLIKKLLDKKEYVICLDDFSTGSRRNIEDFFIDKNFELLESNIVEEIDLSIDKIWHLASPASPKYYLQNPILTSNICYLGTNNMLRLAKKKKAKLLYASTSEIYGIQAKSPLEENMNPNINHFSKRACYSIGKLNSENLCHEFRRTYGVDTKIARIFNTYGPKLPITDGRVIPNFIKNSICNMPLEINGNGLQTRSFCFVNDLIDALLLLMDSSFNGPINLGNSHEISILELAKIISGKLNKKEKFIFVPIDQNEPLIRKPCIEKAIKYLNWRPKVSLGKGLDLTIDFYLNKVNDYI